MVETMGGKRMTERQQELKYFIENPRAYPGTRHPTIAELEELKPLAKQISDRFHFSIITAIHELQRGNKPLLWETAGSKEVRE